MGGSTKIGFFKTGLLNSTAAAALFLLAGTNLAGAESVASPSTAPDTSSTAIQNAAADGDGAEEVIVTARRRAESAQRTPVSVSILSDESLRRSGIKDLRDLTAVVPGVNMSQSGGSANTVYSIRGRSRGVIGNIAPSVTTYVNEIPLQVFNASIPTYDIANVQVLKGPQGTLFGKNSTGGAVLINTKQPTYTFGGNLEGTFGSYAWHQFTGALNIPVIKDKIAVRFAGEVARRDGYTKNDTPAYAGKDYDDIHRNSGRISLLLEPTDYLKNVTVYDFVESHENGTGVILALYQPGSTADLIGGGLGYNFPGTLPQQLAAGPRHAVTSEVPIQETNNKTIINTTTLDLGGVKLKNIFGYRKIFLNLSTNVDGLSVPAIDAFTLVNNKQISEEFQVSGTALRDKFTYIFGLFYLDQKPDGPNHLFLQQFALPGTPFNSTDFTVVGGLAPFGGGHGNEDFFNDTSKAVYGQISYDVGDILPALSGLKADLGYRYSSDRETVCDAPFQLPSNTPVTPESCGTAPGATAARSASNAGTYTIGLDYQINDQLMVYGVTRHGYRAGGLNTPELQGALAPFQEIKPEKVTDFEIGLKSQWRVKSWTGHFNIAGYRANYDALQVSVSTQGSVGGGGPDGDGNPLNDPTNATIYVNAGKARVQGVEAELSVTPTRGLDISMSGTLIDKKITSIGIQLPNTLPASAISKEGIEKFAFLGAPKYSANVGVRYVLPFNDNVGEVAFSTHYFLISGVDYGALHAAPWTKVDLRIDWENIYGSPIDAAFFVTNVFDKAGLIAPGVSPEGLGIASGIYNEPRIFGGQIRYHFGQD